MVDSYGVAGYSKAQLFSRWNGLDYSPILLKISQNIAKFMAYIVNDDLGDDFQQGGCLYKPTSGIQWALMDMWQAIEKADQSTFSSGVVVISYFLDEDINWQWKTFLQLCAFMAGSGKASHKYEPISHYGFISRLTRIYLHAYFSST